MEQIMKRACKMAFLNGICISEFHRISYKICNSNEMKKIKTVLFKIVMLAVILVGAQACFELEEDTSSILTLDNLADEGAIDAALTPIYRQYMTAMNSPHGNHLTAYGADDITTWWAGNKAPIRVFDRFDYGNGENSDVLWLDLAWSRYWKVIYYCNTLIEGLKTSPADPAFVANAEGEARFFRALAYYELVKRWGNMPIILDGMTPTGEETRATVIENYAHIEADLKIAEVNLPDPGSVSAPGKVSKAAAKTLMAEFYMGWAGWPVKDNSKYALAAQKAREVMDMGYFELLPFDELWTMENQNSKESVFAVQYSETEDIRSGYPAAFSFHMARGWSDCYPERQFFLDYPEGLRKEWTFYTDIPNRKVSGGVIVPKDPPTIPWENSERKHPMYRKFQVAERLDINNRVTGYRAIEVYRYAEVLLTFAEATARAGGGTANGEALEALNMVKRRAMGLPYNSPDVSVDVSSATADEIMQEKGWEIAGEFGKRWWDLVRTEKVAEANARRDPSEEVPLAIDASQINEKHYIAPIPFQAITTSSLEQNPAGFRIQ